MVLLQRLSAMILLVFSLVSPVQGRQKGDEDSGPKVAGLPLVVSLERLECYKLGTTVEGLVAQYNDWRKWRTLQTDVQDVIRTCWPKGVKPWSTVDALKQLGAPAKDGPFTLPAHVSSDSILALAGKPILVTLISGKHQLSTWVTPEGDPYQQNLEGVLTVGVVVLVDPSTRVDSVEATITTTKVENPLTQQLPEFIKTVAGIPPFGGGKGAKSLQREVQMQGHDQPHPTVLAWVAHDVALPFRRATVLEDLKVTWGTGKDDSAELKTTFNNTPPTHWGLTATAGVLVGSIHGREQMKVDGGKYASDPLSRAITTAAVEWYPWSADKRFALLGGGVITPAPGVAAGLSVDLIKGLAVNAGVAWMWVPTSVDGQLPGTDAPTDGAQLVRKVNTGIFIGGGYVFSSK